MEGLGRAVSGAVSRTLWRLNEQVPRKAIQLRRLQYISLGADIDPE